MTCGRSKLYKSEYNYVNCILNCTCVIQRTLIVAHQPGAIINDLTQLVLFWTTRRTLAATGSNQWLLNQGARIWCGANRAATEKKRQSGQKHWRAQGGANCTATVHK